MIPFAYLLRNAARRPVELHRADGTVRVLANGATIAVEAPDPACDRLERSGVLTRHVLPPPLEAKKAGGAKRKRKAKTKPAPDAGSRRPAIPPADTTGGSS